MPRKSSAEGNVQLQMPVSGRAHQPRVRLRERVNDSKLQPRKLTEERIQRRAESVATTERMDRTGFLKRLIAKALAGRTRSKGERLTS